MSQSLMYQLHFIMAKIILVFILRLNVFMVPPVNTNNYNIDMTPAGWLRIELATVFAATIYHWDLLNEVDKNSDSHISNVMLIALLSSILTIKISLGKLFSVILSLINQATTKILWP